MIIIYTRLPHRVTVQTETRSIFQGGTYTTSWTTSSTEWANCQNVQTGETKENYEQNKKQQYTQWKITMREITLTNKDRLLYDNKILQILTVINPNNRRRFIKITCREEVK